MRIAIVGNSGSGKTTLAQRLIGYERASVLDLDTVAWEPDQIAVARPIEVAREDVRAFCREHESWVVEGCYSGLIEASLEFNPFLLDWIDKYYSRDGDMSLSGHKTLFENYAGPKQWLSGPPSLVQIQGLHLARQGISSPTE